VPRCQQGHEQEEFPNKFSCVAEDGGRNVGDGGIVVGATSMGNAGLDSILYTAIPRRIETLVAVTMSAMIFILLFFIINFQLLMVKVFGRFVTL
jgi:hypothetical protein